MTTYVVYHIDTARVVLTTQSESAAKTVCTKRNKKARARLGNMNTEADGIKYSYTHKENYDANVDVMVPTYNMLGDRNKVIMIRKSQKGGCCDPATETYHSM